MSFSRKFIVSGHFEPAIEPTNADAPDTQKKASFIASLKSAQQFIAVLT
jgi:hypothetical protein